MTQMVLRTYLSLSLFKSELLALMNSAQFMFSGTVQLYVSFNWVITSCLLTHLRLFREELRLSRILIK